MHGVITLVWILGHLNGLAWGYCDVVCAKCIFLLNLVMFWSAKVFHIKHRDCFILVGVVLFLMVGLLGNVH